MVYHTWRYTENEFMPCPIIAGVVESRYIGIQVTKTQVEVT